MYNLLNSKKQQQTTPKKTVYERYPLGEKSPNAIAIGTRSPQVAVKKLFNPSEKQVKSDEEFARTLQNSIGDKANQLQVSF
jgi:hypothetical protein